MICIFVWNPALEIFEQNEITLLETFSIWEFLAGLGIFLLGMRMIEDALAILAGRPFKKFLRKNTDKPIKAILSGTIVTTLLQSSSVVSLMVLALVGAGIIELANAIGIILGSNLGTTFTGWIVATFGFRFDIESFALPFIAVGGLTMVFFSAKEKLNEIGRFVGGLGFLFLGLEYMKTSIEAFGQNFDITPYVAYGPYFLFLVGFILAAIIQSSSAVMVIALSALNAELIPLISAGAMVIGSDLGTTITVLFGGINGSPPKKRVALSHFIFNLIVDVLALIMLYPLIGFITTYLQFSNPLLSLVAFHSIFNFLGILLFLPFLKLFARMLGKLFKDGNEHIAIYITDVPSQVPEVGIDALKKEVDHLIKRVFNLHLTILDMNRSAFQLSNGEIDIDQESANVVEQYAKVKELEGEMVEFFVEIQGNSLSAEDSVKLKQLILTIRNTMAAGKGLKDIHHNIQDFKRSVNDTLMRLFSILKIQQHSFLLELYSLSGKSTTDEERLHSLKVTSKDNYNNFLRESYKAVKEDTLSDIEISTLFNVNREIHNANKALIQAVRAMNALPKSTSGVESGD